MSGPLALVLVVAIIGIVVLSVKWMEVVDAARNREYQRLMAEYAQWLPPEQVAQYEVSRKLFTAALTDLKRRASL